MPCIRNLMVVFSWNSYGCGCHVGTSINTKNYPKVPRWMQFNRNLNTLNCKYSNHVLRFYHACYMLVSMSHLGQSVIIICMSPLLWRHNDHDSVSNHQPYGCLLNRLFWRRSKKTSKLRVTGLCVGNSPGPVNSPHKWPVTRKMFPFWWRHHAKVALHHRNGIMVTVCNSEIFYIEDCNSK